MATQTQLSYIERTPWCIQYAPTTFNNLWFMGSDLCGDVFKNDIIEQIQRVGWAAIYSQSAVGKTTFARLLAKDLGVSLELINCSNLSYEKFLSSGYLPGSLIVLDEFDLLDTKTRERILGDINRLKNARFLLLTNQQIPHLHVFRIEELLNLDLGNEIAVECFSTACLDVLYRAGVKGFDSDQFGDIIADNFPDIRKALVSLQTNIGLSRKGHVC